MKKLLLSILAVLFIGIEASAQGYVMKIQKKDGTVVEIAADDVKDVEFVEGSAAATAVGGWTEANAAYFSGMVNLGDTVEVYNLSDEAVKIVYRSSVWGTAVFETVPATIADGATTFSTAEGIITIAGKGGPKDYACLVNSGSMAITAGDLAMDLSLQVPAVMGGTTLMFNSYSKAVAPAEKLFSEEKELGGWTNANCAYFSDNANDNDSLSIALNADKTAFTVKYASDTWGTVTFENVSITTTAEGYTFGTAEGIESTISMPSMGGGMKEYAVLLKESKVSADLEDFEIVMSVPAVMGGTTLTLQDGKAPITDKE